MVLRFRRFVRAHGQGRLSGQSRTAARNWQLRLEGRCTECEQPFAAGLTAEEIAESYPSVSVDAVTAALHYATELAKERTVPLGA